MEEFWFYITLGLQHVLDINAYDHILFLLALAIPFTFKERLEIVLLATVFTITHCVALGLSAYRIKEFDVTVIEFLIPVTILITAVVNLFLAKREVPKKGMIWHLLATAFFGLIHGFGFSNYFKMMMADREDKLVPLLGFATGIELSQVLIILTVLVMSYILLSLLKIKRVYYVITASVLVIAIVIPMIINGFPL